MLCEWWSFTFFFWVSRVEKWKRLMMYVQTIGFTIGIGKAITEWISGGFSVTTSWTTGNWIIAPHSGDWHAVADTYRKIYEVDMNGKYIPASEFPADFADRWYEGEFMGFGVDSPGQEATIGHFGMLWRSSCGNVAVHVVRAQRLRSRSLVYNVSRCQGWLCYP